MARNLVITVGREFGSGGNDWAKKLARALEIPCYDKEILELASKDTGISESYFHLNDERPGDKLLYRIMPSLVPKTSQPSLGSDMLEGENLHLFQTEMIKKVAKQSDCVIVGRCADYVLHDLVDVISIFIYADTEDKLAHLHTVYEKTDEELKKMMKKYDKQRSDYYHYYSGKRWSDKESYDLCLHLGRLGSDGAIECVKALYKARKGEASST